MLIPINVDVPMTRLPIANWVLIGVICCTTFLGWAEPQVFDALAGIERKGVSRVSSPQDTEQLTPEQREPDSEALRYVLARVGEPVFAPPPWKLPILALTSTLLHGDWFHLIGNMLFLWVFGNAVNYKFGHLSYLALFLGVGLLSGIAFYYTTPGFALIGASGAIMGIVGAYLVFFPRNDVTMLFVWFRASRVFALSGWIVILFCFGFNLVCLLRGAQTGVAYVGHVAGFVAGFLVALLLAWRRILLPTPYEQTLLEVFRDR